MSYTSRRWHCRFFSSILVEQKSLRHNLDSGNICQNVQQVLDVKNELRGTQIVHQPVKILLVTAGSSSSKHRFSLVRMVHQTAVAVLLLAVVHDQIHQMEYDHFHSMD